jgi:outer membrane protein
LKNTKPNDKLNKRTMKRTLQKNLLWISVIFAFSATAQNPTTAVTNKFSLAQTLEYAKKNNVQVKNALLAYKQQEATNKEITASALPQISANFGTVHNPNIAVQVIPDFISPATYGVLVAEDVRKGNGQPVQMPSTFGNVAAQFGTKWNATGSISLQQLLFEGQVFVALQARQSALDFQSKTIAVTEEVIKANVIKIYYQLSASKTQINLINANLERIEKLKTEVEALYKNGFAERLDIDKINVQITNLKNTRLAAETSILNGYNALKTLIGMPVQEGLQLTDTVSMDILKTDILVDSVNYSNRPEYQLASVGKTLNELNIKRYKYSYLPTVALSGTYAKNAQRNQFNFFGRGDWFTISNIGLNINVPLFDGFARSARIQKAKYDLEVTNNNIDNLKKQINSDVTTAVTNFTAALNTLDLQQQNMQLAEKVYTQTQKKLAAGTGSNTEITAAQTELITAQNNYINALYSAIIAKVDYQKAIGKL